MVSRKSLFVLLVMTAGISAMLLFFAGGRQSASANRQSADEQVLSRQIARIQNRSAKAFGKLTIPAEVFVDLADTSISGGPVTILISAASQIPVRSGILRLKVPPVAEIPAETQIIWSGIPSDFVAETVEYTVDNMPAGKYRFIAVLEFTPEGENTKKLFISKSLYLDVRKEKILSSNVSFEQIKRLELWDELKQRILTDLKTGSTAVGLKSVARDTVTAEAVDPGFIANRIAELKAFDPDVARRIMELNRVTPTPTEKPQTIDISQKSQPDLLQDRPSFERAVPIPEKYRDQ